MGKIFGEGYKMMKRSLVLIILLMLLLPSVVLADETGEKIQFFGDVTVGANETLSGDAVAIFGNVVVDGKVRGNVVAVMGDVQVNGEVMGDVTCVGGRVTRSDTSIIHGRVNQIGIGEGINHMFRIFPNSRAFNFSINTSRFFPGFSLLRFLGTLALSILSIVLFPRHISVAAENVEVKIGFKFLIGLVILMLMPIAIVLLFITLIGIPLIPIAILLLSAAGFFGYIGISIYLGKRLNEQLHIKPSIFVEYLLGAMLLKLIQFIPFIGSLSSLAVLMLGIGITVDTRFGTKTIV